MGTLTTYQIISLVVSLVGIPSIGTVVGWIWKTQKEKNIEHDKQNKSREEELEALRAGVQALLRDRLLQCYFSHIKKGNVTYAEKSNFKNMYEQYERLYRNGTMDTVYEEFMKLPLEDDVVH